MMKTKNWATALILGLSFFLLPFSLFAHRPGSPPAHKTPIHPFKPNGEYMVHVFKGGHWNTVGTLGADQYFREMHIDLGRHIQSDDAISVRLLQKGGGAAHIDAVFLGGKPPRQVADVNRGLKKLSQKDFDVIDSYGKTIDMTFSSDIPDKTLTVFARIESDTISKVPFRFPVENTFKNLNEISNFYTYDLRAGGSSGNAPFFKEFGTTGSGHPSGYTYGWVRHDEENLYVTIDFTPDNTMDGWKDYAGVYVKRHDALQEFKVSERETCWGQPRFTYTDKVPYEHKVYDFKIPFRALAERPEPGDRLQLAFAAYGTAFPGVYAADLAFDPNNNRYLLVIKNVVSDPEPDSQTWAQIVECDGTPYSSPVLVSQNTSFDGEPRAAYDPTNRRFLVVFQRVPVYDIYGQFVDEEGNLVTRGGAPGTDNFPIAAYDDSQRGPAVAHDDVNGRFFVAYTDDRNDPGIGDLHGQLLNAADGALIGSNVVIAGGSGNQFVSAVSFNPTDQVYLVTWDDGRTVMTTDFDIYGQLVNASGNPVQRGTLASGSDNFLVSDDPGDHEQRYSAIAYTPTGNRFLVVWRDMRSGIDNDIYGQFVDTTGLVTRGGAAGADNFPIATVGDNTDPDIAFNAARGEFLAVWNDDRNGPLSFDVYGQYLNPGGTPNGDNFLICSDVEQYSGPHVEANSVVGNFLTAFFAVDGGVPELALQLVGGPCEQTITTSVPTMTQWGFAFLSFVLAASAFWMMRRKRYPS